MTAMADGGAPPGRTDWLKIIGEVGMVVALCAVWLYLAGWRYAYTYFDAFGIGLSSIGVPREYLITYGYWVARDQWLWLLMGLSCVALGILLCRAFAVRFPPSFIIWAVAILTISLFAFGHHAGTRSARAAFERMVERDYPGYRNVQIWMKDGFGGDDPILSHVVRDLKEPMPCYRQIFADADTVFVFKPAKDRFDLSPPVIRLASKDILAMRLRAEEASCPL